MTPSTISNDDFLVIIQSAFTYLADVFAGLWSILTAHTWLLSLVIAPVLVALIVFGVNLAFSLLHKDDKKGER